MNNHPTDVDGTQAFDPWPDTQVHIEWGVPGAALAMERGDYVVLVDILSFSTSVSIACSRGARVLVYSLEEIESMGGREQTTKLLNADIVTKSRHALPGRYSLSPASLMDCKQNERLIVTSLNGAQCVAAAGSAGRSIIGCFRNRRATADYLSQILKSNPSDNKRITLVPCGEMWSSIASHVGWRPSIEDWLGAGAIAERLVEQGLTSSTETNAAIAAFVSCSSDIHDALLNCVSGRELITRSFSKDVKLAAEIDVEASTVVECREGTREFQSHQ
ncbi:2-phosphosulfolactate phosphatase [Gimesia sp.]|uniref:2-phosphosulfolactate phosphatase n=1 Tax=Gimesia sp. TaxID=2024833 RepID=UPI003A926EDE